MDVSLEGAMCTWIEQRHLMTANAPLQRKQKRSNSNAQPRCREERQKLY